jgi:hypothetical protein
MYFLTSHMILAYTSPAFLVANTHYSQTINQQHPFLFFSLDFLLIDYLAPWAKASLIMVTFV